MARALQSVNPTDIVIIGLDTDDGPEHPLYDERVFLEVDENLIRNIMVYGIKHPVLVRQEAGRMYCIDGRQRVKAARAAEERSSAAGEYGVQVPIITETGSDGRIAGIMISANEQRKEDDVLTRAFKARRLIDRLDDMDQVCIAFGRSSTTIKNWLRLEGAIDELHAAVREGKVSAGAAFEISRMERTEQLVALQKLLRGMDGGRVPESAAKQLRQEMTDSSAGDPNSPDAAPGSDVPSADEGVLGDAQASPGTKPKKGKGGNGKGRSAVQSGVKRTWLRKALSTKAAQDLDVDQVKILRWFAFGEQEKGDWFDTFAFDASSEMGGE